MSTVRKAKGWTFGGIEQITFLKRTLFIFLIFIMFSCALSVYAADEKQEKPISASWLGIFGPPELYHSYFKDYFPARMLMKDIEKQGITDVLTFMNDDRGGDAYYQSKLIKPVWQMGKRDFIEEVLSDADQPGIRVWLSYTPALPKSDNSGANLFGLDRPEIIKCYRGVCKFFCVNGHSS